MCYTKKILVVIMGNAYSPFNHCVVAYNHIAQEMFAKKVKPNNKCIWGTAQVMRIKWECTGTPTIIKRNYAIDYVAVNSNGRRNCQRNTIIIVKLKKAKERTAEAEVDVGKIDMFGPFSQGSSNPSPALQCRKGPLERRGHKVDDDNDDNDHDCDNWGRGDGGGVDVDGEGEGRGGPCYNY